MQERGGHMFYICSVCNLAINVHAGALAGKMGMSKEAVYSDLIANLNPGIQLVPSGVWALGRAQENGCGYIFAG